MTVMIKNRELQITFNPKICQNCHPTEWSKFHGDKYECTIDEGERCLRCVDCNRKLDTFEVIYQQSLYDFSSVISLGEKYKREINTLKTEKANLETEIKDLTKMKSKVIHKGFKKC